MDPHSRAPKKNTSHGNEVLPQGTTNLIQRPCYQRGSTCKDPAGNWTTRRPDDRKETQTAVGSCFPSIRSGQNHLARRSELVSWCVEPSQPQMFTSGLNTKLHSSSKLFISQVIIPQVMFLSLFIFRGHSTREPASGRVTNFILRAYTGAMC